MLKVGIRFEPRDAWVGVYWEKGIGWLNVYVCVLPFLPIGIRWRKPKPAVEYGVVRDRLLSKGFTEVITDDDGDPT